MEPAITKMQQKDNENTILMFPTKEQSHFIPLHQTVMELMNYCMTNQIPFAVTGHPEKSM